MKDDEGELDLGDYFFSKLLKGVFKRTPKKRKLDEIGKEIIIREGHNKVMVRSMANQPPQKITTNTTLVLGFSMANREIVHNLNVNVGRLNQQILYL